jgi:DNA-binding GntR family transcriptional regulator
MPALVQPLLSSISSAQRQDETALAGIVLPARETLGDRVTQELRALLIAGRLVPGEKLSLRKVADALGVSMMPVREAMSRLAADGALEILPGKAVRVPVLTLGQFRELTRVRLVIEGFAAEEAALKATSDGIADISRAEAAFRDAASLEPPDSAAAVACNRDFHFAVYNCAGMPTLVEIIERLWLKAGPILNLDMRSEPARLKGGSAMQAHGDLVAALRIRDPAAARRALEADITAAAQHIEDTGRLRPD